jgi:hypothetical protein
MVEDLLAAKHLEPEFLQPVELGETQSMLGLQLIVVL